jgi:predicted ATP-binding protein involved in virulence
MRIDRLRIKNFKGFADKAFDFPRSIDAPVGGNGSFHLIIGQNGKGKTSTLDALAVAVGSWFLGVRGAVSRHIQPGDIRVKINEFNDTARIEKLLPVNVTADGIVEGVPMTWERELRGTKTRWVDAKNIKAAAERAVTRMQEGEPVTLPLVSYYGTGRLWQEPREKGAVLGNDDEVVTGSPQSMEEAEPNEDLAESFASRLAGYRFSIDPRCSPRDLLSWLKFEQQLSVQDGKESLQFKVVKDAIQKAVEGCKRVDYHLRLGLLLEIEGQPRLPFSALSDGQRNMVAMVGDLAFKAAQLNPHLGLEVISGTPGVVLIDELDLHLHPRWQRHVVEDLRNLFPEVQFIATTHSPFIVQTLRDGELISLDLQTIQDTGNLGVEEIARGLMGVERPEVSPRYAQMKDVAKSYLETLEEAKDAPEEKLKRYLDELSRGISVFADNPAYQAFLEMKREAKLGDRLDADTHQRSE